MNFAFDNLHDFMAMGRHGVYVWSAWSAALLSIIYLIMQSRYVRQQFIKEEQAKVHLQNIRANRLKQESLK
ncbi:MAG: heme exporter protein CcmD [Gammaproteobacteria bacterium]|nr:heme exporter protein CcmD [Gammaproteobacteria bacterium]